jgi:hypothetical protein
VSKQSRRFQVPDALANLYDFANTLDVWHFTHHGVPHRQRDELKGADDLAAWMAHRKLARPGAKIAPAMFQSALDLRASLRDYLRHDPPERRTFLKRRLAAVARLTCNCRCRSVCRPVQAEGGPR